MKLLFNTAVIKALTVSDRLLLIKELAEKAISTNTMPGPSGHHDLCQILFSLADIDDASVDRLPVRATSPTMQYLRRIKAFKDHDAYLNWVEYKPFSTEGFHLIRSIIL